MKCNICQKDRSGCWFENQNGSFTQPCHSCRFDADRFSKWSTKFNIDPPPKPIEHTFEEQVEIDWSQYEPPTEPVRYQNGYQPCLNCNLRLKDEEVPSQKFLRVAGGFDVFCYVCRNRYNRELKEAWEKFEKMKAEALARKPKNPFDIPIKGVERQKVEKYTIRCRRCRENRDPQKIAVVADVCQYCWEPHEAVEAWEIHRQWVHNFTQPMAV